MEKTFSFFPDVRIFFSISVQGLHHKTMADFNTITNRLIDLYGDPSKDPRLKFCDSKTARDGPHGDDEAVNVLVETVLSQNTTDKNSHRAFLNLKQRWPLWSQVIKCD